MPGAELKTFENDCSENGTEQEKTCKATCKSGYDQVGSDVFYKCNHGIWEKVAENDIECTKRNIFRHMCADFGTKISNFDQRVTEVKLCLKNVKNALTAVFLLISTIFES